MARDFFQTFGKSDLAANPWILTGHVLSAAAAKYGIASNEVFNSEIDIEEFHTAIESEFLKALDRHRNDQDERMNVIKLHAIYTQLILVFAATINAIQNGPISNPHLRLAQTLEPGDSIITFNWDTLMDRALQHVSTWETDSGYGFSPHLIYREGWQLPSPQTSLTSPNLWKLHGSSNWLTSYPIVDYERFELSLMQTSPVNRVYVFEAAREPYPTWQGRFQSGFENFSYGYYPPNLPDDPGKSAGDGHLFITAKHDFPWMPKGTAKKDGLLSSPLIIPPVKQKTYKLFGDLFDGLWRNAEDALARADKIALIGYSFPRTDTQSIDLFRRAFCRRNAIPKLTIVDPMPDRALEVIVHECGIPRSAVKVFRGNAGMFNDSFDVASLWEN